MKTKKAIAKKEDRRNRLDPNGRTISIGVTNKSDDAQEVKLFAALQDYPQNDAVEIDCAESNYGMLRKWLIANVMTIVGMCVNTDQKEQFAVDFDIFRKTPFGEWDSKRIKILNWQHPENKIPNQIDMIGFTAMISCETEWVFTILPKNTILFILYVENMTCYENFLLNSEPVKCEVDSELAKKLADERDLYNFCYELQLKKWRRKQFWKRIFTFKWGKQSSKIRNFYRIFENGYPTGMIILSESSDSAIALHKAGNKDATGRITAELKVN